MKARTLKILLDAYPDDAEILIYDPDLMETSEVGGNKHLVTKDGKKALVLYIERR